MPITIDFFGENGATATSTLTLPSAERVTLKVNGIPGLEATAVSAVVHAGENTIAAERTMRWDARGYGASTDKAIAAAGATWLFAEGSQGFFSTFLLLFNPQPAANDVTVRFLREGGLPPVMRSYTLSPRQRLTIDIGTIPELLNQSFGMAVTFSQPGAAERSMYFGRSPLWTGGHEAAGVPAASTEWFLAEGATGAFFKTFLLLANPSDDPAEVTLTYLSDAAAPVTRTKHLPGNTRLTINLETEDPALANVAAVATHVTSDRPIVVERSQYWPYTPDQWYESHNSFGVTAPARRWAFAEGRVGGPEDYQTYYLLFNPNASAVDANVSVMREGAPGVAAIFSIPPMSRLTLRIDRDTVPNLPDGAFGALIGAILPIVVERSMYWNAIGQIWAAGTNATGTKLP